MTYKMAMKVVMENQPPKMSPNARRLCETLARRIPGFGKRLQFYTAIGSALDQFHGVDGFLVLGKYCLTMDLSQKDKFTHRADLLINYDDFDDWETLIRSIIKALECKVRGQC